MLTLAKAMMEVVISGTTIAIPEDVLWITYRVFTIQFCSYFETGAVVAARSREGFIWKFRSVPLSRSVMWAVYCAF